MSGQKKYTGLTTAQVEESRAKYGSNILTPPEKESLWKKFLEKFEDPIIRILLVAWVLSMIISAVHCWGPEQAGLQAFLEPIGIFFAIILASTIGFFFEVKAARAFELLNTVNDDVPVTVERDGHVQQVGRKDVVVGDIVILNTGDEVPADGLLLESTRKMGQGNLDTKVDKRLMIGCFWDFARELNNLADVANVAAQKQLKSERMKTELITNVSHDIKTPLTSIINYVDLLQKPHTEEEGQQYMEVLDRQSQRLKKLVEDLMDMSKASTGNMTVEITRVDAVESVNQALGEFADKLERARLYPVFRHADDSVPMMADGKLVWRVLSNLLGNAVKYAMPGTRVYLDLTRVDGNVVISMKNISRDELNVDAEELMERFVRGDVSRNTEGSGLGLNIAKSLMELQKGQLQLLVDGDLFKVTLIFPAAD